MSSDQPTIATPPTPVCGNCGVSVQTDDVTCPACGVLLAAYQAPAGATANVAITTAPAVSAGDTSASREVASTGMGVAPSPATAPPEPAPVPPVPPRHLPRSRSPIGDALRHSRDSRVTAGSDLGSADIADELARMATNDSTLAREVDAELAGARVTFDGASPVIETDEVDVTHTEDGAPVIVEHVSKTPMPATSAPVTESARQAGTRPAPVATSRRPVQTSAMTTPVGPAQPQPLSRGRFDPATLVRWIPFILFGCVMLGVGRSLPGFGGVIGLALVIALIYLLVKVAAASSRKTTSMPRDESWNTKRPRRRK